MTLTLFDMKLYLAIEADDVAAIQAAHAQGANVDTVMKDDKSLLHKACEERRWGAAKALLDLGAGISHENIHGDTAFDILLEKLQHAWFDAALANSVLIDVAKIFVTKGAAMDRHTDQGYLPLQWAMECGQFPLAEEMIRHGADVNGRNQKGETCLTQLTSAPVRGAQEKVFLFLIEHGADIYLKDGQGRTVIDIVAEPSCRAELRAAVLEMDQTLRRQKSLTINSVQVPLPVRKFRPKKP